MQRILIVEDEQEMARGLRDILEFEGYEVVTAATGKEGLQSVSRKEPDCIILDLMLPDINGYQICEEIRRQKFNTPIIMLTAKAQDYDKIRGLEVGADDYLTKPFSVGELLARVKAILRRTGQYAQDLDVVRIGSCLVDVKHFTAAGTRDSIRSLITKLSCSSCFTPTRTSRFPETRFSTRSGVPKSFLQTERSIISSSSSGRR